jgi:hypothetical protein
LNFPITTKTAGVFTEYAAYPHAQTVVAYLTTTFEASRSAIVTRRAAAASPKQTSMGQLAPPESGLRPPGPRRFTAAALRARRTPAAAASAGSLDRAHQAMS